eukprot:137317-Prorocentrum_minimum.AAC.5
MLPVPLQRRHGLLRPRGKAEGSAASSRPEALGMLGTVPPRASSTVRVPAASQLLESLLRHRGRHACLRVVHRQTLRLGHGHGHGVARPPGELIADGEVHMRDAAEGLVGDDSNKRLRQGLRRLLAPPLVRAAGGVQHGVVVARLVLRLRRKHQPPVPHHREQVPVQVPAAALRGRGGRARARGEHNHVHEVPERGAPDGGHVAYVAGMQARVPVDHRGAQDLRGAGVAGSLDLGENAPAWQGPARVWHSHEQGSPLHRDVRLGAQARDVAEVRCPYQLHPERVGEEEVLCGAAQRGTEAGLRQEWSDASGGAGRIPEASREAAQLARVHVRDDLCDTAHPLGSV